jgi:hypothetical protein
LPGLVRAWGPPDVRGNDRMPVRDRIIVGRSTEAGWSLPDAELSGQHFEVRRVETRLLVRDLESTNGSAVNGEWLVAPCEVEPCDLLRAGRCLFVIHPHPLTSPSPTRTTATSGTNPADRLGQAPSRFVAALRRALREEGLDPLPVVAVLRTEDLEALTLLGPSERAAHEREMMATALAGLIRDTEDPPAALFHYLMLERHGDSPVYGRLRSAFPEAPDEATAYERRREAILGAYRDAGGDLSKLEALLRSRGIPCSRRWLSIYLERWGAHAMRLPRRS